MKQISKDQMKQIYGGKAAPIQSTCGVTCSDGNVRSVNCGLGVSCTSDSSTQTVWCDAAERCPCG